MGVDWNELRAISLRDVLDEVMRDLAGCVPEFRLVFATGIDRDRAFKAMGADRRDGEFEIVWGGR